MINNCDFVSCAFNKNNKCANTNVRINEKGYCEFCVAGKSTYFVLDGGLSPAIKEFIESTKETK